MENLKQILYRYSNKLIGRILNFHKVGKEKDILIFSFPRSGSTLLMETIYSQPMIIYINEPLHPIHLKMSSKLKIPNSIEAIYSGAIKKEIFLDYINKIRNKKIFVGYPNKIYKKEYSFFTNRRVFKIIRRLDLINNYEKKMNVDIIYLLRHPIPTILSWIRNNYTINCDYVLKNKEYITNYLDNRMLSFSKKISRHGTMFEKLILFWCLENNPPLNFLDKKKWLLLTYEDMINFPVLIVKIISKRFNLPDKIGMLNKLFIPSATTKFSDKETKLYLKERKREKNQNFLITKWKKDVNSNQIDATFNILEKFNIKIYKKGDFMPDISYLS